MKQPVSELIDIVLPVHNEAECIEEVLREFHAFVNERLGHAVRFIVCEDGSTDDTVHVIQSVASTLPIRLISAPHRRGYARAVIAGLRAAETAVVGFIDSDGQCDPRDFPRLLEQIARADLVVGYRRPRADSWGRRLASAAFGRVYRSFFPVSVRDPSCPYLLVRASALRSILHGDLGVLPQGFWWEFAARAEALRLTIEQVPVRHRARLKGQTQVYGMSKLPGIAARHLVGLWKLRRELNSGRV